MAALQIAAKMQELLIVASLAAIVIQVIRREMLNEGAPLGLIGRIFSFSSVSYVWSPEFWGAMRSSNSLWAKLRLYGIVLLAVIVASTAGPATAVLMIPRTQPRLAGGSQFWI
jgi:hypothetical protein